MSDLTPPIATLAETIRTNTDIVSNYLNENSLPPLSFSADAYPFFPGTGPRQVDRYPRAGREVLDARQRVRRACEELMQLMDGPAERFFYSITQHMNSAALQYLYHFRIAEHVPVEGEISFKELAANARVDENRCSRVVRMAMTSGYFQEPRRGVVAHTAGSRMFLLPDMRDAMGYVMEESFPGAGRLAEAVERYPGSEEKNHTAWNIGHSTELPIFEFLEHHPARMQRFLGSMRMLGGGEGFELTHMLAGFDWRGLGPGLVVDVGGSAGHCSDAIAEIAPELRFVAQDLEKVVEAAKEERKNENKENPRISFKAHDFFTPQPIQNADVYLLRFICHDYSDKYAAKILASITPAMGPNSRIVVVESIVPPAGSLGRFDERRMRILDMEMMTTFNALERDFEGWVSLFHRADPRLELRHVVTPPGATLSVMELGLRE